MNWVSEQPTDPVSDLRTLDIRVAGSLAGLDYNKLLPQSFRSTKLYHTLFTLKVNLKLNVTLGKCLTRPRRHDMA